MRPRIGITSSTGDGPGGSYNQRNCVNTSYIAWVERHGGLPLLLPNTVPDRAAECLQTLDGLLLSGGEDLHPRTYGREPLRGMGTVDVPRDAFEQPLIAAALASELPILGICRGIQALNVVAGGTLRQDLATDAGSTLQHRMSTTGGPLEQHRLQVVPGTRLHALLGDEPAWVNSYHHQAVDDLAPGFAVCGTASDGVVEAIERPGERFVLAVQFHPEVLPAGNRVSEALFAAFLSACRAAG
ncbi:MAG: gamma-glutamyl-gamma-aminobutyrate hydrolase family protein [Fimbriimonadaceae bacterium]|nr:gamma-glutamyl-gamma-aminobutyrate hydrolase family protein [Fimbriimonadaceae bacterium]